MENTQDRIDAYIRGEMNASERSSFSKELSHNKELWRDYEFTRNIANSISDRERKKRQIRKWNKKSNKTIYLYSAITSIAAMLVVGFFLFHNISPDNNITTSVIRSSLSSEEYAFTEISQLIADKNYSVALKYIEEVENNTNDITSDSTINLSMSSNMERFYELKWYKAQALLGLERAEEAQIVLKEISNSNSGFKVKADSLLIELQLYNK